MNLHNPRLAIGVGLLLCWNGVAQADPPAAEIVSLNTQYPYCKDLEEDAQFACWRDAMFGEVSDRIRKIRLDESLDSNSPMVALSGADGTTGLVISGLDTSYNKDAFVMLTQERNPMWAFLFAADESEMGTVPKGYPYKIPLSAIHPDYPQLISIFTSEQGFERLGVFDNFTERPGDLDGDGFTDFMLYAMAKPDRPIGILGLKPEEIVTITFMVRPGGSPPIGEPMVLIDPSDLGKGPRIREERHCKAPASGIAHITVSDCELGREFFFPTTEDIPPYIIIPSQ